MADKSKDKKANNSERDNEEEQAPQIADDDLCPICHLLLFDPVKTTCNHGMCYTCFTQWADFSATTQSSNATTTETSEILLGDFDDDDALQSEVSCPMCRTMTKANLDSEAKEALVGKYPEAYEERRVNEEQERGEGESVENLTVLLGNRHELIRGVEAGGNRHHWTFFVRFSRPEFIRKVVVRLHPTFRPPAVTLYGPTFEISRRGWGVFELRAAIELKAGYTWVRETPHGRSRRSQQQLEVDWMLQFDDAERAHRIRARIKKT